MKHLIILLLLPCLCACLNNDPISDFNSPVEYDIPKGIHLSDHNGEILLINTQTGDVQGDTAETGLSVDEGRSERSAGMKAARGKA